MPEMETYDFCSGQIGYAATLVRAAFMSLAEAIRENQARGNISFIDGIASVRNYVTGGFEGLGGPWTKGRNLIVVKAVGMDPFKSSLADAALVNSTEGAKPVINTVLDEITREYGTITGTDVFSIAGADLAPDTTKDDEYVAIVDVTGVETRAEISYSDLQNVRAKLAAALPAGEYTLVVRTRSGMGEDFGVRTVTRKVVVG